MSNSSHPPRLVRSDGQETVVTDQLTIGRSPECSVQINDNYVSRKHALLGIVEQQVMLSDLGSSNGTWVNDRKITTDENLNFKRGWIKTDMEVSEGNSDGMAVNQKGELVGVPTFGIITDTCKIGYVRPVNWARPLIQKYLP